MSLFSAVGPAVTLMKILGFSFGGKTGAARCCFGFISFCIRSYYRMFYLTTLVVFSSSISVPRKDFMKFELNYGVFIKLALLLMLSSALKLCCKEADVKRLLRQLSACPLGQHSRKCVDENRKWLAILIGIDVFLLALIFLYAGSNPFLAAYVFFGLLEYYYFVPLTLLALPFLALICLVAAYCPSRLDDVIWELSHAHSPVRRSKMAAKLLLLQAQLSRLATLTNGQFSILVSVFKLINFRLLVEELLLLKQQVNVLVLLFVGVNFAVSILYIKLAPEVNEMVSKVSRALVECMLIDDEWCLRHSTDKPYLIKMRCEHLFHLTHAQLDAGQLTLLGPPVDRDAMYSVVTELTDLWNTLQPRIYGASGLFLFNVKYMLMRITRG